MRFTPASQHPTVEIATFMASPAVTMMVPPAVALPAGGNWASIAIIRRQRVFMMPARFRSQPSTGIDADTLILASSTYGLRTFICPARNSGLALLSTGEPPIRK